jgi:hypothetical protein
MSVRDDPVLFLEQGKGKTVGGSSVGGGSAITTTHVHRLNGPEHTLATDDDRLNATGGEPGLLPKLSGIVTDVLRGDGTWGEAGSADCTPVAHGDLGSTETFDPALGEIHTMTLTADCTPTLTAPDCDASFMEWWVTQDGTGGWEFVWPGSVTEEGTHDTTPGTTQRVLVDTPDGGTNYIATWTGGSSSLTVKDEGSPLATAATSIDFVGDQRRAGRVRWRRPVRHVPEPHRREGERRHRHGHALDRAGAHRHRDHRRVVGDARQHRVERPRTRHGLPVVG